MYYEKIPGFFDFEDLYRFVVQEASDQAHFVEVGTFYGRSACFLAETICESQKQIRLDAIDPFLGDQYDVFLSHLEAASVTHIVTPLRMLSEEAASRYQLESLDFVFIDADHSPVAVARDIALWYPLVKTGGILAGHDYSAEMPDLMRVVEEHFGEGCAVPPRSWAVRKVQGKSADSVSHKLIHLPRGSLDPMEFDRWKRAVAENGDSPSLSLAFEGARYGEAALETLLHLARSEHSWVRYLTCGTLATLLTPPQQLSETASGIIWSALEAFKDDPDEKVRRNATASLRYFRDRQVRKAMLWLKAREEAVPAVADASAGALALLALQALPRQAVAQAYRPKPGLCLWDCLDRVQLAGSAPLGRYGTCIATAASPQDAPALEVLLSALEPSLGSGTAVVVFAVEGDAECAAVALRYGALLVPCHPVSPDTSLQSMLYSVARVVDADKYLCLWNKTRISGSVRSLLDGLDALYAESLLIWPEESSWPFVNLLENTEHIRGNSDDAWFLMGDSWPAQKIKYATPSAFAGRHHALQGLDRAMRNLQPFSRVWIEADLRDQMCREAIVFSLALAKIGELVGIGTAQATIIPQANRQI